MDWQEQLKAFRDANPDLPQGSEEDSVEQTAATTTNQPRLDISIERKGRAGKTATLITGWILSDDELRDIASQLKRSLGVGGSARGGDILLQGDYRNQALKLLSSMGYKARII